MKRQMYEMNNKFCRIIAEQGAGLPRQVTDEVSESEVQEMLSLQSDGSRFQEVDEVDEMARLSPEANVQRSLDATSRTNNRIPTAFQYPPLRPSEEQNPKDVEMRQEIPQMPPSIGSRIIPSTMRALLKRRDSSDSSDSSSSNTSEKPIDSDADMGYVGERPHQPRQPNPVEEGSNTDPNVRPSAEDGNGGTRGASTTPTPQHRVPDIATQGNPTDRQNSANHNHPMRSWFSAIPLPGMRQQSKPLQPEPKLPSRILPKSNARFRAMRIKETIVFSEPAPPEEVEMPRPVPAPHPVTGFARFLNFDQLTPSQRKAAEDNGPVMAAIFLAGAESQSQNHPDRPQAPQAPMTKAQRKLASKKQVDFEVKMERAGFTKRERDDQVVSVKPNERYESYVLTDLIGNGPTLPQDTSWNTR